MKLAETNEYLGEVLDVIAESKVDRRPKHKGKTISFAELDGPFTIGPGGRGDFERGEYVISYLDDDDDEIGSESFRSRKQALAKLDKLARAGVECGSLT